jgi:uncharacterized protein YkwD
MDPSVLSIRQQIQSLVKQLLSRNLSKNTLIGINVLSCERSNPYANSVTVILLNSKRHCRLLMNSTWYLSI